MRKIAGIIAISVYLIGCSVPRTMMQREYQERPKLETFFFRGDQDFVSEEAVQKILSSKIQIPSKAKIAVFKYDGEDERLSSTYYGYNYWRSENYIKLNQQLIDTLQTQLLSSGRASEVTLLPTLLVPRQPSVAMLRQAAVRMQADLIIVFRITGDTYYDTPLFAKDQVKAYSNCELILFDTRTGIIPFTSVATRDYSTKERPQDLERSETIRRAQKEASLMTMGVLGKELAEFLKQAP